ncbi:MAG: hypothetical protein M3Q34_02925 [bacterium]|nr:hypothetical protein [bacterium]
MKTCNYKKIKDKKGFVVLFAVVLASIVLSVALGVANIAYKELIFTTSAKNSNEAFYAADTGAECALYYDRNAVISATGNAIAFGQPTSDVVTECAGTAVNLNSGGGTKADPWIFHLFPLGSSGRGCAEVSLWKDDSVSPIVTTIDAKGYNIYDVASPDCSFSGSNRVERHIQLTY